ncbi:MAG: helix-turn-helix transcriptional regulator [Intestinibacter sp.]|uniref:helix-turn-helix transcriptional regulator n=1 Tax=Intestinibacter sp. TaxID=1965304 RepID=UPI003F15A117
MNFIISTMTDFYQCCNIPVKAVSCELEEIYKIGYDEYFDSIYPINDIYNLIDKCESDIDYILNIDNNIYYKILSIDKYRGFFVLGPISTNKTNTSIPYRTLECLNYCSNFILNIASEKFNQTMDNKSFNLHIKKAIEYVHDNYDQNISIDNICKHLNINKSYFCSIFKAATGYTFCHFLNHFRIEKSKNLLLDMNLSILDVAIAVGFNNQNYYSTVFKKFTGETPFSYRISALCKP